MGGGVQIERLRCRYRVPRGHPRPGELRLRLDGLLRERVPAACGELLAPALQAGPGVALIRRLDLKLTLSRTDGREARTAALWGRAVAVAVARALAEAAPERVIRFDSEAARLARLVEEIAWGTAWDRWYHAEFQSLSGLPASAAIRTALLLDPRNAVAALAELRRNGRLRLVSEALTDADAWSVALGIEGEGGGPGADRFAPERVREALAQMRPALIALDLVAQLADGGGVSPGELELARHLGRAAPVLQGRPGAEWTQRKLIAAAKEEGEAATRSVAALLAEAPALLATAAGEVGGASSPARDRAAAGQELATPHGGLLLLLPALAELDLERRLAAGGSAADAVGRLAPLARWKVLLECVPSSARQGARHDPVLAVAAGLTASPDAAELAELAEQGADSTWTRLAARLLRRFAHGLPGFERSSPAHLARNFVAGPSRLRIAPSGVTATLPRAPLQVVLRVAGWDGSTHAVPWLPGGSLTFEGDGE